ncbi:ATP-binding protein [Streptomyces sp. NPDC018947]|uniref:ATP-binding protein n=1 Tax=Streptomyces sp. NPDC018947 TaxID=3365054 RepID=UPI0037A48FC5
MTAWWSSRGPRTRSRLGWNWVSRPRIRLEVRVAWGRRSLSAFDAQRGQSLSLLGHELCPGARFLLPPPPRADVVAREGDARRDVGQAAVGVGKTHIAQALGHLAVRQGAHVRFAKTSRILADLAGGHADRTWEKRIREVIRPDVLILDDFAMRQLSAARPMTPHADRRRLRLIRRRHADCARARSRAARAAYGPAWPGPDKPARWLCGTWYG